ncbi:hypothetical protein Strop_0075 [Salinispora tropica CNB-440]|uniref:Uncharacterized protein n=1 Tax=Salinispora tropica (strain ATCC BAA-916 / DSM 44818 / JCM 13857 / NBRC 105044 / CNB-440) TaxID=369723 RepID=A4X110_SALTO|nr:hypothetical protein Strop_0075 [Salinispora tropica CNB-440]
MTWFTYSPTLGHQVPAKELADLNVQLVGDHRRSRLPRSRERSGVTDADDATAIGLQRLAMTIRNGESPPSLRTLIERTSGRQRRADVTLDDDDLAA